MTPTPRQYLAGVQIIGLFLMTIDDAKWFAFLAFMGVLIPILDTREYKLDGHNSGTED